VTLGHRVSVCTTSLQDESSDLDVPLDQPVERDGITVYYSPTCCFRYWGYSPGLASRVDQLMPSADVVLVHFHYQYANWAGARLARRHHKPYVTFAHGSFRHAAIRGRGRLRKAIYLTLLEHANLRDATLLVFNAPEERDGSRFSNRGIVLPNGIDPCDFLPLPPTGQFRVKFGLDDDTTVLLFLGRLDVHRKGLDLLLPAFAQAAKRHARLHLVLAGPDERNGRRLVEQQLAKLNIRDRVLMTGMLAGVEKLSALTDADAFVLPSRSEGLSISLLEALYLGLPVLISDRVGLHEQVSQLQAGIVVTPTIPHLTEGLLRLARPEVLSSMRGRATEWIRQFHLWPAIADKLIEALTGKLNPERRPETVQNSV
jgi:glycosyltransferase involved in cell wall biosynthesis